MTGKLLDAKCPYCGANADGFTAVEDGPVPAPGDVAICLYCCEFNIYDGEPLVVRKPTSDEIAELVADPEMVENRAMAQRIRAAGGFEQRGRLQ